MKGSPNPDPHSDPNLFVLIMAGGGGTRFWPLSRRDRPKQFLAIASDRSLLQATWDRALGIVGGPDKIVVVTAQDYGALTREQLPDLPDANLLLEPQPRNTAPCIAWASAEIRGRDPEAVTLVLPADHLIHDHRAFGEGVAAAVAAVRQHQVLATFGIPPRYPETGYGYIEAGAALPIDGTAVGADVFAVEQFREKPDRATAEGYVEAGNFFWNGGIFVWRLVDLWAALQTHLPDACTAADRMVSAVDKASQTRAYAGMPATSIDFGLMERAENVAMVEARFDWSDVGSWAALHEVSEENAGRNVAFGQVVHLDAQGNLVHAPESVVALLGVEDLAVVQAGNVVLVASLDRSQDIKILRERLEELGLGDLL